MMNRWKKNEHEVDAEVMRRAELIKPSLSKLSFNDLLEKVQHLNAYLIPAFSYERAKPPIGNVLEAKAYDYAVLTTLMDLQEKGLAEAKAKVSEEEHDLSNYNYKQLNSYLKELDKFYTYRLFNFEGTHYNFWSPDQYDVVARSQLISPQIKQRKSEILGDDYHKGIAEAQEELLNKEHQDLHTEEMLEERAMHLVRQRYGAFDNNGRNHGLIGYGRGYIQPYLPVIRNERASNAKKAIAPLIAAIRAAGLPDKVAETMEEYSTWKNSGTIKDGIFQFNDTNSAWGPNLLCQQLLKVVGKDDAATVRDLMLKYGAITEAQAKTLPDELFGSINSSKSLAAAVVAPTPAPQVLGTSGTPANVTYLQENTVGHQEVRR